MGVAPDGSPLIMRDGGARNCIRSNCSCPSSALIPQMEILKQSIIDAPGITRSRATQKEPDYPSCWPTIRELVAQSEFVSQRELHHARLGQQAGVGSETVRRLGKRSEQR